MENIIRKGNAGYLYYFSYSVRYYFSVFYSFCKKILSLSDESNKLTGIMNRYSIER